PADESAARTSIGCSKAPKRRHNESHRRDFIVDASAKDVPRPRARRSLAATCAGVSASVVCAPRVRFPLLEQRNALRVLLVLRLVAAPIHADGGADEVAIPAGFARTRGDRLDRLGTDGFLRAVFGRR